MEEIHEEETLLKEKEKEKEKGEKKKERSTTSELMHNFHQNIYRMFSESVPLVVAEEWSSGLFSVSGGDQSSEWVTFYYSVAFSGIVTILVFLLFFFFHKMKEKKIKKLEMNHPDLVEGYKEKTAVTSEVFGITKVDGSKGVVGYVLGWAWADTLLALIFAVSDKNSFAQKTLLMYLCATILTIVLLTLSMKLTPIAFKLSDFWRKVVLLIIISINMLVAKFWAYSFIASTHQIETWWIMIVVMISLLGVLSIFLMVVIAIGKKLIDRAYKKRKATHSEEENKYRRDLQDKLLEITSGFCLGSWSWQCWRALWDPLENFDHLWISYSVTWGEFFCALFLLTVISVFLEYLDENDFFFWDLGETYCEVAIFAFSWIIGESIVSLLNFTVMLIFHWDEKILDKLYVRIPLLILLSCISLVLALWLDGKIEDDDDDEKKKKEALKKKEEERLPLVQVSSGQLN